MNSVYLPNEVRPLVPILIAEKMGKNINVAFFKVTTGHTTEVYIIKNKAIGIGVDANT